MNSFEFASLRAIATLTWRDYRAQYPSRVILGSSIPRAILQVLFVAYVGQLAGGANGRNFALVGAGIQVITLATVIKAGDQLFEDHRMGTLFRARLSPIPLPMILVSRLGVFIGEGLLSALIAVGAVDAMLNGSNLMLGLLTGAGFMLLAALSSSVFGLAIAVLVMGSRSGVFYVNFVSYLLLALTGAVAPLERLPSILPGIARVFPTTNGLLAMRHWLVGQPWLLDAVAEILIGAMWLGVAVAVISLQARHAGAKGTDDRW